MFSTARPPWHYQCQVTYNPTILPPALRNARYEGWPHPPIQLPHVASPSSTARHITVANDTPSHRPQANAAHTRTCSKNIFLDDYSVPRTMSSNVYKTQNGYPHPFLATPSAPVVYDLRFPPTSLAFPSMSPYAGCGYGSVSPNFPWTFDVGSDPGSAGEEGVTCLNVLITLHAELQCPLTDTEWGTAGHDRRASLIRARDRRSMIQPALQGSSNSAARTRPTVRSVPGASALNNRPAQRERILLRVDWLGSRVVFVGLIKDEAFARSRLIPGGGEPPETWVVKFKRL
ncbi:hypothetical protein DFJ58DRAFT_777349 [Suillus subalutaceus]|uniref:uncharacterized protein n=1 Tax=Suillus subalutaceus TaxID=48586 RepID=UPI001B883B98|nr:uncharacterized protein DFJ58DRAFT_777349 [Suillus subalutaceus]KAG1861563.1 hypothetical protein DFJ58DRAFT_777349 [Suillus subalutaceus]